MHIEFLVEDTSGKIMLNHLCRSLLPEGWTYRVKSYRGVGTVPIRGKYSDPDTIAARMLLDNLPRLLEGYGKAYSAQSDHVAVIVVCDLDRKNRTSFEQQLSDLFNMAPHHLAKSYFCLAIEEGEAWLLGDKSAVCSAYPKAKRHLLARYKYDSICGTWEVLADIVYPGGSKALMKKGYQAIGTTKCEWAARITPLIGVNVNQSPSFRDFATRVRKLES